jgi:nucleolar pre-ribosomal-associated protein 2
VSNSLLDDQLNVYLPNAVTFVFELLIDRLNDSKQNNFRGNTGIWSLFNKTWRFQDKQPKIRNRSFQSLRFGEVISSALQLIDKDEESINIISETFTLVRLGSAIIIPQDNSLQILASYLQLIQGSFNEKRIKDIISFFNASSNTESYTPKFITLFVSTVLPYILSIIQSLSAQPLIALIRKTVLYKDNLSNLKVNVDLLLERDVSGRSLVCFYKLIVDTTSKNDIETLEHIFNRISKKFPETSEALLEYISCTKRTLSQPFLLNIFDAEFGQPKQNWKLVHSVLELDIEVGIKHAEKIMNALERQEYENYVSIGQEIIDGHVRARELISFFQLWTQFLSKNSRKWGSSEFCKVVSKSITTLSSTQLKQLVESLMKEKSQSMILALTTIIQGLFSVRNKIVMAQAKEVFTPIFGSDEASDDLWNIRYQLLCLYEDIISEEHMAQLTSKNIKSAALYQCYTFFRIRELIEYDTKSVIKSFMKFVRSEHDVPILKMIFERWFVLLNQLFQKDQVDQLVSYLLEHKGLTLEVIANHAIFEQAILVGSIITNITASIDTSSAVSQFQVTLLKSIPIQCYPRRVKVPLLDSLTDRYLEAPSDLLLDTILHILQTPTFKSKVESDLQTISQIVQNKPESKLFESMWRQRISNIKESQNLEFLEQAIKFIGNGLSKRKDLSPTMYMAFTVLSSGIQDIDTSSLQSKFIESSKSLLNSYISKSAQKNTSSISWLLKVLYKLDLKKEDFETLYPVLVKFGELIQSSKFLDTKANLFLLLTKYKEDDSSVVFLESLYVVLRETGVPNDALMPGLTHSLSKLSDNQFDQLLLNVIHSIQHCDQSVFVIEILTCYWATFQRSNKRSQELLVKSVSKIASSIAFIQNSSLVMILHSLRSLLVEKTWIISQYGLELVIALLSRATDELDLNDSQAEECFTSITLCMSNILLFHRYRLSGRHHIVMSLFTSLMKQLTRKGCKSVLQHSKVAAESYQRLLANLCEPPQSKESHNDSLSSTVSVIKRSLRKHLHVLLLSYIHLSLTFSFEVEVREVLLPGIFGIFDVLSDSELLLVSTSLDYSGRVYYRKLYDEYKKVGKWQTD